MRHLTILLNRDMGLRVTGEGKGAGVSSMLSSELTGNNKRVMIHD